jgi:hypothetical protein
MSVPQPEGTGVQADAAEPADLTRQPGQVPAPLVSIGQAIGPTTEPTFTDWARISLAGALLLTLAVLTLGSAWVVAAYPSKESAIVDFLKFVYTPIVGLVGSVVGFYFGSRAAAGNGN